MRVSCVVTWKMQFAMSEIEDTQWNFRDRHFFIFSLR